MQRQETRDRRNTFWVADTSPFCARDPGIHVGEDVKLEEALKNFKSGYDLCKQLNIAHSNLVRWKKQNFIPVVQQLKINMLKGENLPIDLSKEDMLKRVQGER